MGCLYALWRWCFVNPFKGCCCSWRRRLNDTKSKSNIWTCLSKQTFSVQRHFSKISILRMLKVFLFIKMGHSRPLFVFLFSLQSTVNSVQYKFCRWLDSNCGPLVLEATALPTEPQPLPLKVFLSPLKFINSKIHARPLPNCTELCIDQTKKWVVRKDLSVKF